MNWRRWDSLEEQSKPLIHHQRMKIPSADVVEPKSLTRLISSREYTIVPEPGSPRIKIELPTEPNLDPFRNDPDRGRRLHNLRMQRAVIP